MPYLTHSFGANPIRGNLQLYTIIGVINLIGSLAFAVGFIILILKTIKWYKNLSVSSTNKHRKDILMDDSV
jgi:uncharacterized membrane protein